MKIHGLMNGDKVVIMLYETFLFFVTYIKQALLAAEDYLGALDILQSAKRTVQNDLGKLQSLKHVSR